MADIEDKNKLLNSLTLDASLDDIEDLPGFVTPPTGNYIVNVVDTPDVKEINDSPYLEVKLSIVEVSELADLNEAEDEKAPMVGDQFSYAYNLGNKIGVGNMKKFLAPIAERLGTQKLNEIAEGMKGMQLTIVNKRTYNKVKDRFYAAPKKVIVV